MDMRASSLPPDWHATFTTIARQEIDRLLRLGVRLDYDDALALAVSEAWIALALVAFAVSRPWGYARIVMRRRLITQYVHKSMRLKYGGPGTPSDRTKPAEGFAHVPIDRLQRQIEGRSIIAPASLVSDPWEDAEEQIALEQALERYRAARDVMGCAPHVSRQRRSQARKAFVKFARGTRARYDV